MKNRKCVVYSTMSPDILDGIKLCSVAGKIKSSFEREASEDFFEDELIISVNDGPMPSVYDELDLIKSSANICYDLTRIKNKSNLKAQINRHAFFNGKKIDHVIIIFMYDESSKDDVVETFIICSEEIVIFENNKIFRKNTVIFKEANPEIIIS